MSAAFNQALYAYSQHDYKVAEHGFLQVLKDEPENAHAMINLQLARVRIRRHFRSDKFMKRALALAPNDVEILRGAASVCYITHRVGRGIPFLKQARALEPQDAQTHALLASGYLALRKKEECEAAFTEALRLKPHNAFALQIKGSFETIYFDVAKAAITADIRLRQSPESTDAHLQSGRVCLAKGDVPQAYRHFREALRISPNSPQAREALATALIQRFRVYNWLHRLGIRMRRYRYAMRLGLVYIYIRVITWTASSDEVPKVVHNITVVACIGIAVIVAIIVLPMPFVTFAMRFHPIGRYAMTRVDKAESGFGALVFATGLAFLVGGLITQPKHLLPAAAVSGVTLVFVGISGTLLRQLSVRWVALSAIMLGWAVMTSVAFSA